MARELLPLVEDNGWFFDSELLILAEHNGLRIHEVPVDWVDDADSRVDVVATARDDLKGVLRVLRSLVRGRGQLRAGPVSAGEAVSRPHPVARETADLAGQIIQFAGIGAVSTVMFALLFSLLFGPLGAVGADVVALALCGTANLAANRRLTFSVRGRAGRARHYGAGSVVALLPLLATLGALGLLVEAGASGLGVDLMALTGVNLAATGARFLLLRHWVFPPSGRTVPLAPRTRP